MGVGGLVSRWGRVIESERVVVDFSTDVDVSTSFARYILGWVHAILERLLH